MRWLSGIHLFNASLDSGFNGCIAETGVAFYEAIRHSATLRNNLKNFTNLN
jgi:hypothetical protein